MLGAFLTGMVGVAVIQRASAKQPAKNQKIIVARPQANEVIHSPVTVAGKARGAWFFEATFPVKLLDGNGQEITDWVPAHAQVENWMTEDFIPFEATLEFKNPATATGTLTIRWNRR